jgi:3-deoxy-D-manno-octulosonate 8-phosphate phosphatase (KDO 8-P phosphatase)
MPLRGHNQRFDASPEMDLSTIRLLVLDVDGVLTDGRITAAAGGDDAKSFHAQDGCAIKMWQKSGGLVAILSGRKSGDVQRRADELGITLVRMGMDNKLAGLKALLEAAGVSSTETAYMGDDLPDLEAMRTCGLPLAPNNSVPTIKRIARFVTRRRGGEGAVAEAIELILRKQRLWNGGVAAQS